MMATLQYPQKIKKVKLLKEHLWLMDNLILSVALCLTRAVNKLKGSTLKGKDRAIKEITQLTLQFLIKRHY